MARSHQRLQPRRIAQIDRWDRSLSIGTGEPAALGLLNAHSILVSLIPSRDRQGAVLGGGRVGEQKKIQNGKQCVVSFHANHILSCTCFRGPRYYRNQRTIYDACSEFVPWRARQWGRLIDCQIAGHRPGPDAINPLTSLPCSSSDASRG